MDVTWKNFLNSLYNKGYVKGALQTFTYNGFNEQELLYYNMSSGAIVHATSYRKLVKCAFSYCELQKGIDQLNPQEALYLLGGGSSNEICILRKNNHIYLRIDVSETFGPLEDLHQKFEFKSYWDEFPEDFVRLYNTSEREEQARSTLNKINVANKIRSIILS